VIGSGYDWHVYLNASVVENGFGEGPRVVGRSQSPVDIEVAYKTDIGKVRSKNEDSYLVLDLAGIPLSSGAPLKLVAVADGLGGHAAGGTASRMAIECLRDGFESPAAARLSSRKEALAALKRAFAEANRCIHTAGAQPGKLRGMGTTMVAAIIGPDFIDVCNVGDSRAYVLEAGGNLRQVTKDHSWEAEYGDQFKGGAAEVAGATNLLTRALGPQREVESDEFSEDLGSNEALLLCSDGLSGMIPHSEIAEILSESPTLSAAVDKLVETANKNGGEDNITVVAAKPSATT
jgi:protein phosphatase